MILYELAHRGKRPYWQVAFIALFFCARFLSESVGQLNQDFDLIRQKIIAGERPKFDDVTAPAESVFLSLLKCLLHFDALQVPAALQVLCAP